MFERKLRDLPIDTGGHWGSLGVTGGRWDLALFLQATARRQSWHSPARKLGTFPVDQMSSLPWDNVAEPWDLWWLVMTKQTNLEGNVVRWGSFCCTWKNSPPLHKASTTNWKTLFRTFTTSVPPSRIWQTGRRENGWCLVWLADVAVLNVLVFQSESEISTKFQFQARGEDFMFQVLWRNSIAINSNMLKYAPELEAQTVWLCVSTNACDHVAMEPYLLSSFQWNMLYIYICIVIHSIWYS